MKKSVSHTKNTFDSISKEQKEFDKKHYGHVDTSMTLSKCFTKQLFEGIAEQSPPPEDSFTKRSQPGEDMSRI